MTKEVHITAASAAAALARKRVAQGLMSVDDALLFSNWIDRAVKLGQIPDDPKMLGLIESDWKIASSSGHHTVARVMGVGRFGISLDIVKPRPHRRKRP